MKICIVGGGTTGWWAAGYLEHHFPDFSITLIESPIIPKIGVGESSLPQIKSFFDSMGIQESEWMSQCHAVKKTVNIKQGWDHCEGLPFHFTFWLDYQKKFARWVWQYRRGEATLDDFDQFNHADSDIYAYHLDADQAGAIVKNRCRNIEHLQHTIERLPLGYDLYLDCTGLRQDFVLDKSAVVDRAHQVDRAVVLGWELPPDRPRGQTWTIARPYGWQFEIDLTNRLGSGYVYSSRYLSEAQAIEDFYEFNRHRVPYAHSQLKTIKWSPGYLKNPWTDHVLAMGLAAGFIDPLESNALYMTQYSITLLASCLKKFKNSEEGRRAYNRSMRLAWRTISKYLLHTYMLSKRRDTDFWKYYDRLDGRKSLWENYRIHSETWTNIYPRAMWALLGTYYREFTYFSDR